jgi:hypothetical protein
MLSPFPSRRLPPCDHNPLMLLINLPKAVIGTPSLVRNRVSSEYRRLGHSEEQTRMFRCAQHDRTVGIWFVVVSDRQSGQNSQIGSSVGAPTTQELNRIADGIGRTTSTFTGSVIWSLINDVIRNRNHRPAPRGRVKMAAYCGSTVDPSACCLYHSINPYRTTPCSLNQSIA